MNVCKLLIVTCLCCAIPLTAVHAQVLSDSDLNPSSQYCSGLLGNSLAFAFASGVSAPVPALSAGFLAASVAFAVAAIAIC